MDVGTGIAIAGVWVFVSVAWASGKASAAGMWVSLIAAVFVTVFLK